MIFPKFLSAALLCLLSQGEPKPVLVPKDFAIRVNYGNDVIDTFQNTFTRKGVSKKRMINEVPILMDSTISFKITPAEKAAIYNQLMKMKYTTYPSQLKSKCVEMVEPGGSIIITVRARTEEKTISYYDDCIITRDERAIKLESLVELVNKIAGHYEQVKQMPASLNIEL